MSDLVERLRKRAEIRLQIASRKSVQEGKPDRIAEVLIEAAAEIARVTAERNGALALAEHTVTRAQGTTHVLEHERDEARAQVTQLREALSLSLRAVNSHQAFEFAETRAEQRLALQDREAIDAIEALGIPEAKGWNYEEAEQRIETALAATDPIETIENPIGTTEPKTDADWLRACAHAWECGEDRTGLPDKLHEIADRLDGGEGES